MCSGVMSDGSLRIVRNGIGMIEQASVELPGIKGMWALRASAMDAFDKYLVLSFVGETRILAINEDDELDEAELAGFNSQSQVCVGLPSALVHGTAWLETNSRHSAPVRAESRLPADKASTAIAGGWSLHDGTAESLCVFADAVLRQHSG